MHTTVRHPLWTDPLMWTLPAHRLANATGDATSRTVFRDQPRRQAHGDSLRDPVLRQLSGDYRAIVARLAPITPPSAAASHLTVMLGTGKPGARMVQAGSALPPVFHGPTGTPKWPRSKRLSPFSTENLVYAAVALHRSARFQQLWMTLLITTSYHLQKDGLCPRHQLPNSKLQRRKNRSFRGSCAKGVVEKALQRRYNGDELSARVEQPIRAQDRGSPPSDDQPQIFPQ